MANNEQLNVLKQHFPNCFDKNGAFIPDKLQAIVEENGVKVSTEGYSLNWLGKSYARLLTNEASRTLLKADTNHNTQANNTNSQNLLIKGDNLEVLKHLKGAYSRQVKMIYIDPPYNTGSDGFVYADDRKFTADQLSQLAGISEEEAQRVLDFTSSKSNSHSAWLTFMYPRLYIARDLLANEGVIFISIDDNEQSQLKILCDEVFGEENLIANLPVIMNLKGNQDSFGFADVHEYVIAYANKKDKCVIGQFEIDLEELEEWKEDDWGLFKKADTLKRTGQDASREKRPKGWFPVFINEDDQVYVTNNDSPLKKSDITLWPKNEDGEELSWSWSKKKIMDEPHNLIVVNGRQGKNIYKKQRPQLGEVPSKKPKSFFYKPEYSTSTATTQLKNLMGKKIFDGPKPVPFIKDLVFLASSINDVVLDFFAGSGTAAHAVMQLNAEDGGNRQFICVQLPEVTDAKSEAHKAGYKTIFDITHARITKAAAKIKAEYPDYPGDLGFKVFETVPVFEGYMDEPEALSANLELFNGDALTAQDRFNLLLTWAVQDGITLTSGLTPVELAGYTAYQGGEAGRLLYFIHPKLSLDVVVELLRRLDDDAKFAPKHLVVWGYGLDSKEQREMSEAIAHHNKSNRKGIELDLEVRF